MIPREKFAGNEKIFNYLNKTLEKGCVSHAYLFEGPQHVGKMTMALYFSAQLLKNDYTDILKNPDFTLVSTEGDDNQISVDAIRNLQKNLSLYPYKAKYKIAIIEKAELMNTMAANALLKTLEEPGQTSIIILISSDASKIPDTIKSRCQTLSFNTVKKETIRNFLQAQGDRKNIEDILELADGKPGMAIALAQNENILKNIREEKNKAIQLFNQANSRKMEEAALIGTLDKKEAAEILDLWIAGLRKELVAGLQTKKGREVAKTKDAIEKIISVREDILNNNVNLKLAIENLCLGF